MTGQSQFNQLVSNKEGYYLYQWSLANETNNPPDGSWTGFLLYQQDIAPPKTLSFSDAWQNYPSQTPNINGGCYLFCRTIPSDYSTFLDRLIDLLEDINNEENSAYRYFFWLFNPDATTSDDLLPQCLPFINGDTALKGKVVNQTGSPVRNNAVSFGNIYLDLSEGVRIDAIPETNTIRFKNFNANIQLCNSNTFDSFGAIGNIVEQVALSLDDDSGALRFNASFSTQSINGNDFIKMEAGVRYFIKNGETDSISQLYPLWSAMSSNVTYSIEASLDPLWPENHDRTYFQFIVPATNRLLSENRSRSGGKPFWVRFVVYLTQMICSCDENGRKIRPKWLFSSRFSPLNDSSIGAFLSSFITPNGHAIWLAPVAVNARLVFMGGLLKSNEKPRNTTGLFYIAPAGDFIMSTNDAAQNLLMCGLSGTESLTFQSETTATKGFLLGFKPDMPAYAANFPFLQASPVGPPIDPSAPLLDDTLKTSWITLLKQTAEGESTYIALPKGFSLYGCDNKIHKDHHQFLGFTAPSSNFSLSGNYHFPMVPYTGVQLDGWTKDRVETFEKEVLSPTRRIMIAANNPSFKMPKNVLTLEDSPTFNITTPSGQLVTLNKTGAWEKIPVGAIDTPYTKSDVF